MATYAAQAIPKAGLNATYNAAAGGGDRVPPGSILHVKNANGSALVVTLVTLDTADGDLVVTDRASSSITATTGMAFIAVPRVWPYVDPADGLVGISWSVSASVTFAVVSAP
jgi:hypothetical protein